MLMPCTTISQKVCNRQNDKNIMQTNHDSSYFVMSRHLSSLPIRKGLCFFPRLSQKSIFHQAQKSVKFQRLFTLEPGSISPLHPVALLFSVSFAERQNSIQFCVDPLTVVKSEIARRLSSQWMSDYRRNICNVVMNLQ